MVLSVDVYLSGRMIMAAADIEFQLSVRFCVVSYAAVTNFANRHVDTHL